MRRISVALLTIVLAGCTVGPNYHKPAIQTPDSFRSPVPIPAGDQSLADLKWWDVFKDDKLQDLEKTALVQNYDLRDAVARVDAARASLTITRADQYPNFAAAGDIDTVRLSRDGQTPLPA